MITYDEALQHISSFPLTLSVENIPLKEATHRIAAQNTSCTFPLPEFNNSAMDGYAIRSMNTNNATEISPAILNICAHLQAGNAEQFYGDLSSIKIMTGACVPDGYDAVIPVEQVHVNEEKLYINRAVEKGENVRYIGEDFNNGDLLMKEGTHITSQHVMALAACGVSHVKVFKKPVVGILSTGKELKDVSHKREQNSIYNSNGPYLSSRLKDLGCEVVDYGTVPDDVDAFKKILEHLKSEKHIDCFVTTGAVSMGDHDFIPSVLESMGGKIIFHKVAIRPGKPILFAQFNNIPFFGLPGNPISTAVGCTFFVEPLLNNITKQQNPITIKAILNNPYTKKHSLRQFLKAVYFIDPSSCCLKVNILEGQESFKIKPFSQSNCWVILDEEKKGYATETPVLIRPINNEL